MDQDQRGSPGQETAGLGDLQGTTRPPLPAYVIHWTDYSPTRKRPLNRDVRLAPDQAAADRIAEQLVHDNIKRGWTLHSEA